MNMRKVIFRFALLVGLFTACASAGYAKPGNATLWEISKDGNLIYLAGSIHLLRHQDYPMPAALILNRNSAWIPVIETYLTTEPIEFVIVGMGYLYGPDGLLTQLKNKGYTIKQLVNN